MADFVTLDDIHAAREKIAGVAVRTGLYGVDAARLRAAGAGDLPFSLFVKAENEQPIGSFKLRGAYNCIAQLSKEELQRGVITYSSGNHAQGVAYAARALGAKAVIVMPEAAPMIKREATLAMGAEVVLVGPASSERLAKAQELSSQHGYRIIPPYDHPAIIAGQGTCGLEIVEQMGLVEESPQGLKPPSLSGDVYGAHSTALRAGSEAVPLSKTKDKVVVLSPVSGGGLLSGIATAAKLAAPGRTQVWAAEPELAADATESFRTRKLVEWPAEKTARTICDGLRTQSMGVLNFAHVMRYVDGMVNVSEDEILRAMRIILSATDLVPEPSGAATFAAALFHHGELPPCERMVAVLSGGNIDPALKAKLEADASAGAAAGV